MSAHMLQRLQGGTFEKEFPRIADGKHTFAVSTFGLVKTKNKKGVPSELIQIELVTLTSSCHKPGSKLNHAFYIGFPDEFEGQSDQAVSRALTFVKHTLGLETLEETQKAMGDIFASLQNTSDANVKHSFALFGLRVECTATAGISKKGSKFVEHSWEHVDGQTPEVVKTQADELAGFLGIALPTAVEAPAPAGGSLLGGLKK